MKNKPLTYILAFAVLGIWGYVFYSIFSVTGNDTVVSGRPVTKKKQEDSSTLVKSQYKLLANYPDPFLKSGKAVYATTYTGEVKKKPGNGASQLKKQKQQEEDSRLAADIAFCKQISYSGMIRNNTTKKYIAILTIENKEYMLAAGESASDIMLVKIAADSVEVKCRNRKMYIHK